MILKNPKKSKSTGYEGKTKQKGRHIDFVSYFAIKGAFLSLEGVFSLFFVVKATHNYIKFLKTLFTLPANFSFSQLFLILSL